MGESEKASGNLEKVLVYLLEDVCEGCTHFYSPLLVDFYLLAWTPDIGKCCAILGYQFSVSLLSLVFM